MSADGWAITLFLLCDAAAMIGWVLIYRRSRRFEGRCDAEIERFRADLHRPDERRGPTGCGGPSSPPSGKSEPCDLPANGHGRW